MKKRSIRAVTCAVLTTMLFSGCAAHHLSMTPKIPAPLSVPNDQKLSFALRGVGVQIYVCKAVKKDPARFDWAFLAPEAVLLDDQAHKLGKHYAGPTWEANDGSKVVGEVLAKDNGPDPAAVPWLLLRGKAHTGTGIFSQIVSIQRLNTEGGKAPADRCTRATAGTKARVPYTANYYFYGTRY
ncbi:MAG: DUF3455 domain-containing protein [Nitrospirota bacterium]